MKRFINILIIAAALVPLSSSCVKEVFPYGGTTTEDQVTLETIVRGIPAALVQPGSAGYGSQCPWDFGLPAIHLATESMTGDLVISGNIGYDWFEQWGANDALGPEYAVGALTWDTYYTWIMSANNIIRIIKEKIPQEGDYTALDASEKNYLGLAYTYRAMFYLDLVRLYEFKENKYTKGDNIIGLGVPIVIETTTEDEAKNNPRAKVEDIYNTVIIPDLDRAEKLLQGTNSTDPYTIGIAYVYGLKARTYLERGTAGDQGAWEKAAEYARMAINISGRTPLTQSQWEDPTTGFNNATANNSWIWGLALPSESISSLNCFTAHMSTENSWSAYGFDTGRAINRNLYNSVNNYDFRKHSWLDPDRSFYEYKSCREDGKKYFAEELDSYVNIKFRPAQGTYDDYKIGSAADHPCMRVEEMYFIEAEATAHINLASAKSMLNDFMNKWRMTGGMTYDCSKRATVEAFVDELILQKRIEFWGEGIVMFDMKRLDMSTRRGYVGTNAPASYRLNTDGRAPYWNFCITRGETQNNTALAGKNNPDPSGCITPWKN